MATFQRAADERFADFACDELRRVDEARVAALSPAELRERVLVGLSRARSLGFPEAELAFELIRCFFRFGPGMIHDPDVLAALRRDLPRELLLVTLPGALSAEARARLEARAPHERWV